MRLKRKHLDELAYLVRKLDRSIENLDGADNSDDAEAAESRRGIYLEDLHDWVNAMRLKTRISKNERRLKAAVAGEAQSSEVAA